MLPVPSPNIWRWPEVYEVENRAQDATGALWAALAQACPWDGAELLDVGCGDGFHLPRFAAGARSVIGVEPFAALAARARRRVADLPTVSVLEGQAANLPLPDGCADVVHARTAYFFGPGCEPGLAEAERVLRPGGTIAVVDLDGSCAPYGDWMRADMPRYRSAKVERFFARRGFSLLRVDTLWRFDRRADLEAVLGIDFSPPVAARAIASTPGLTVPVGYRLHVRRKPTGPLTSRGQALCCLPDHARVIESP